MTDLEMHHRIAIARELTAAAGYPLRDRYGFAASDRTVTSVLVILAQEPNDDRAVEQIGLANLTGAIQIADGYDTPTDEDYEMGIVRALRPLIEDRRNAAARSLR